MLRRTRSTVPLVASLVVVTTALAACGSDAPGTGLTFGDRLSAVTVSGDVGAAKLEFNERMSAGDLQEQTLVEGTGAALKDKDEVFVNYVIGNGYTKTEAVNSFDGDAAAVSLTVGAAENAAPQTFDDVVANLLRDYVKSGVTKGSRIAITGNSPAMFGDLAGSPALTSQGIGNDDGLILVADVSDVTALDGPDGAVGKNPGWAPKLVFDGNGPTGFDFTGIDKPGDKATLLSAPLKTGTGKKVEKTDTVVLNYLGAVYGADKPFDESYTKEPLTAAADSFVEGFNQALEGRTVGSRIVVRIPPALGYKDQAQGKQIPANSTLYFVIDILAAV